MSQPDTNSVPNAVNAPGWHALSSRDLLTRFDSRESGLSVEDAQKRLEQYGVNRLPEAESPPLWQIFFRQFQSPFVYILLVAAVLSLVIKEWVDAGFIFGVLCLNALIGTIQEWKAEKSARSLQQLLKIRATVERDGRIVETEAENVVPGDIVWLESGNRVPADVRLLLSHGLEINESLLTGESLAVTKDARWQGEDQVPIGDRINMGHAGTIVIRGRGKGVVVATGLTTEVGRIARSMMGTGQGKPPLMVRMERFSQMLAWVVMVVIAVVGLLGILIKGYGVMSMLMFGIALAVAVIPEGLPVALTIALAIGTNRMARRGVIVRRLAAVEGLGSCTLIASDKTGTLTCNELTVREIRLPGEMMLEVSGHGFVPKGEVTFENTVVSPTRLPEGLEPLLRTGVLCNEADLHQMDGEWVFRGDPTDIALLSLGQKMERERETLLSAFPQVNQIPFEPEYQFSASFHKTRDGVGLVCVKGSPERVISMCTAMPEEKNRLLGIAEDMASRGLRVLALAEGAGPVVADETHAPAEPSGLTFLGFVGMIDPLREGVREAVANCRDAGVEVAIITGDHPITARAIARDLGLDISEDQVVTGTEIESKTPEEVKEIVRTARVFARVAPNQKLELVSAMQESGHFVAVTGDGVNDAPALRKANIGSAMGKSGTDVAREAAELVISDDNFATIVGGVEEGRIAYNNIRKVIFMLISTGAAEVVLVMLAVSMGLPLPLTPVQLLWLNLVTQGIQDVGMAFEPGEGDELKYPPRDPGEPIFNHLMIERTAIIAIVMGGMGFALFQWLLDSNVPLETARNILLLFVVLFVNIHMVNCRSEYKSAFAFSLWRNPFLAIGVTTAFLFHVMAMHVPLGQLVLKTQPVDVKMWVLVTGLASTSILLMEWHKRWWNRRHRRKTVR